MTKLTIDKTAAGAAATPSAEIIKRSTAEVVIKDSKGRSITLRKPGVLAQYRLIEALGPTAENRTYTAMVLPLIYVGAIDGDGPIPIGKKSEIEALIQRLDEHGIDAVMKGVVDHFGEVDPSADKAKLGN